jgi:hypothetical protein
MITFQINILNFDHWNLFVIWPVCAKPLRRRQVLGIWNFIRYLEFVIWNLQYSVFPSVFIQSGNRGFDRNRLVSPEPAFILARKTLRAHPPGKNRVPCKGWFAVFDHQDSPVEELTSCCTCVGFTADAFALIDNHFDRLFFKMHEITPP